METADAVLDYALVEQRRGNVPAARELLENAVQTYPDDVRLWVRLGNVVRRSREYAESVRILKHALDVTPNDVAALIQLTEALRLDYRAAEALETSMRLIDNAPDDPSAQNVYALALAENSQPHLAFPIVNRLTLQHEENGEFWVSLARVLVKLGRFSEAERIVVRVIESIPDYAVAYGVLASASYGLLHDREWMGAALKAYELDPNGPVPLLWMARMAERSEDPDRERKYLFAALKVQPRMVEAHVMLGSHHWRGNNLEAAEAAFLEAVSIAPMDGTAQGMLAQFRISTGRGTSDLPGLQNDAESRPYSHLAFYIGRIFLASLCDHKQAIQLLEIDIRCLPESIETMQLLGQAYLLEQQWQSGFDILQRLVALCPNAGRAWHALGIAAQNLGDKQTAGMALDTAVRLLPDDEQAHFDRKLHWARGEAEP